MTIEAPVSSFKKNNIKLFIAAMVVIAVVFGYDGYLSKYEWSRRRKFYDEHVTQNDGVPDSTMKFNIQSPPFFLGAAVLAIGYFFVIKDKKLIADEEGIKTSKYSIAYESIQSIDKTHFDTKGYFIIAYKDQQQNESRLKLSDRTYDNLREVLDALIAKIS